MRYAVANNARTRLTATLLATHDIIHVESTSAFPLAEHPYLVSINDEILEVKPTSSTTFAILNRGCEGTTPTNHAIGDTVENRFTAGTYEGIFNEIGSGGPRTVRFVVGTSTAGWTLDDCDYLCDGTDDHVEIQQALDALPDDGGEVKLLDGTYYFEDGVTLTKDRTTLRGSGNATKIILGEAVQNVKNVRIINLPKNYCTVADISVDGNYQGYYSVRGVYVEGNNNTITGNTCNNNDSNGIYLYSSSNNTIIGNTCIRGTGQPSDYTSSQYTIHLSGSDNSYNLISSNNCMGKDVVIEGGTSNTSVNNKYN